LRVLQLIQNSIVIGDKLVHTTSDETQFHAQALEAADGTKKLLLVNKLDQELSIQVADFQQAAANIVDVSTGGNFWRTEDVSGSIQLPAYAVAIITMS
jgi:hypothetical protein